MNPPIDPNTASTPAPSMVPMGEELAKVKLGELTQEQAQAMASSAKYDEKTRLMEELDRLRKLQEQYDREYIESMTPKREETVHILKSITSGRLDADVEKFISAQFSSRPSAKLANFFYELAQKAEEKAQDLKLTTSKLDSYKTELDELHTKNKQFEQMLNAQKQELALKASQTATSTPVSTPMFGDVFTRKSFAVDDVYSNSRSGGGGMKRAYDHAFPATSSTPQAPQAPQTAEISVNASKSSLDVLAAKTGISDKSLLSMLDQVLAAPPDLMWHKSQRDAIMNNNM